MSSWALNFRPKGHNKRIQNVLTFAPRNSQRTMLTSGQALDKPLLFPSLWSVALFTPESIQTAAPTPTPTELGRDRAAASGIITYREQREMKLRDPPQTPGFSKLPCITTKELKKTLLGRQA